jgi:GNAT superfamily N-acetyltransferase
LAGAEELAEVQSEFTVAESTAQSLDDFILLLDQVGTWLWDRGIKQWEPGTFQRNRDRLERFLENGCLILAYEDGNLAGGCILSAVNPGWPTPSDDAMYLNSLAVARFAAGKGLGAQIIDVCTEAVRQRGKSLIRLDCWDGNSFLKTHYQKQGFKMLGAIPVRNYFVRLFEKDVLS